MCSKQTYANDTHSLTFKINKTLTIIKFRNINLSTNAVAASAVTNKNKLKQKIPLRRVVCNNFNHYFMEKIFQKPKLSTTSLAQYIVYIFSVM